MGTSPDKLSERLLGKTRARLLGLLFGQPGRSYYLTELFRLAGVGRGAVQRELASLNDLGLVTRRQRGNQTLYRANARAPVFAELEGFIRKTSGLAGTIAKALSPARESIRCAFVFGSVAAGTAGPGSDVDLLIIGDISLKRVAGLLVETHELVGREINPIVLSPAEFVAKLSRNDGFIDRVLKQDKLYVEGTQDDLEQLAQDRPAG